MCATPTGLIFTGLLSLVVGSFIGVVVKRSLAGRSVLTKRSACEACARPLTVPELIPIASFIALRGRCASCGAAIAPFHLIIELAALAAGLSAALVLPADSLALSLWLAWILLLLAAFDVAALTLPLPLTIALAASGIAVAAFDGRGVLLDRSLAAAGGFAALELVRILYRGLRKRDGLGGGDSLLFAGAGAWLGVASLAWVAFLSSMLAIVFVVARSAVTGARPSSNTRHPFGSFLAAGIWIVYLHQNAC